MNRLFHGRLAALCAGLLSALVAAGCDKAGVKFLVANAPPSIELTAAPISQADTTWYAYKMNWSGTDPDGRIARFEYAIDPPPQVAGLTQDTLWISTQKNEEQLFFRATHAYFDPTRGWRSNDKHTFVVRAIDDAGAYSVPKFRSFFSYTVAPVVSVTNPLPSRLLSRQTTPAVRISWQGRDEDGVFSQKPVKYKYRLFKPGDFEYDFDRAISQPDSLRIFYAAQNFAGWDSVRGDTTFVQYAGLTPQTPHLFVVIGIDEAGAYSPDFSLETNMLQFTPGFANTLGPRFVVFNEFFFKEYQSGGYSTDELAEIKLEVPAGLPVTFNWIALPDPGSAIEWYRWRLDGDLSDETQRSNEDTDWYHWSRKSNLTTTCTIGPFAGGEEHYLYIAAQDNNKLQSLAVVHMKVVQPTLDRPLLIVDDTRISPVDGINSAGTGIASYGNNAWPAAAELDTFLYARGGFPWRGPQGMAVASSKPGLFAGYAYDTMGTRLGIENPSVGIPLSRLGHYAHVIWYTDVNGHESTQTPVDLINPPSYLRWMCEPGHTNTLATYMFAGGEVWLAGGATALNTLKIFNKSANDTKYGAKRPIYSFSQGELVPGRLMYDYSHWRGELVGEALVSQPRRSPYAVGGWSSPGRKYQKPVSAPDYLRLPTALRRRSLALGDTLPPTCIINGVSNQQRFYSTALPLPFEYMTDENRVVEDFDPSPTNESQRSALDTLMYLAGGQLVTLQTGRHPATMTYYYGTESARTVFSGFDFWSWSRVDCQALVDFVLQDIWGLTKGSTITTSAAARAASAGTKPIQPTSPTRRVPALPGARSGSR